MIKKNLQNISKNEKNFKLKIRLTPPPTPKLKTSGDFGSFQSRISEFSPNSSSRLSRTIAIEASVWNCRLL